MGTKAGRRVLFSYAVSLLLLAVAPVWPPLVRGAEHAEFVEVGSERGWRELRVHNAGAIDLSTWCGATETFLTPLRYGHVQVVNVKARTISSLVFGGFLGRLHCSHDGRYVFSSSSLSPSPTGGRPVPGYRLRYYDTQTGQLHTVFEGLLEVNTFVDAPLASPQGKYLIGPRSLGPVVTLPGGEQLTVIPPDSLRVAWPVEFLLWAQDDSWLIAANLTPRTAAELIVNALATDSQRWKTIRQKSHVRGSSPTWLAADTHRLYYRRSDQQAGGGPLWKADLSATKPTFQMVAKDVQSFDVSADGTIVFSQKQGVRYKGDDRITTTHARDTVKIILPGGREQMLRERSLDTFGSVSITSNGRALLLGPDAAGGPFTVLTRDRE